MRWGNGPHSTMWDWSRRARSATTGSGAPAIGCVRLIAPPYRAASCRRRSRGKMQEIHNDTTSVMVRGAYDGQNPKAVQLKRGHSEERRPDLKQLVYSLCITADGAVPVHFKAYDGKETDDGIHLETWNRLRTLLQHPRFIYVADCKLCTEKNLRTIDGERGI